MKYARNPKTGLFFNGLAFEAGITQAKKLPDITTAEQVALVWECPVELLDENDFFARSELRRLSYSLPSPPSPERLAVVRAESKFRELGPWSRQRTKLQRENWQRSRDALETARRAVNT